MSRFFIGSRVESMHNRCEPTGLFGTVVCVREVHGYGTLLTVNLDHSTDNALPRWEHESYFRPIGEEME